MADRQRDFDPLLDRIRSGDKQAIFDLFERDCDRLRRMVELRMDSRLQTRFDPSDVLQVALVDVVARVDGYLQDPQLPPFLWLRLCVGERLRCAAAYPTSGRQDAGRRL